MRIAIFPGGFDPVTNGHLDLVERMIKLFDEVIIAVVKGREKSAMFTWEERVALFEKAVLDKPSVSVEGFEGLTVDFAHEKGAVAIVRGIRAVSDFEAEFDMALMNRKMAPTIESVYLMTNSEYMYISASRIREVSRLGYDVADFVPLNVREAIHQKLSDVS